MKYKIVVSGGGTGGHYYPAYAVIKELEKNIDVELTYFTIYNRLDYFKVPKDFPDAQHIPLKVKGLIRPLYSIKNINVLINTYINYIKVKKILKQITPNFIILTGGYVTVPVGLAAKDLNIPIFILEQNKIMGVANRVLSKYAKKIFLTYNNTIGNKYPEKSITSGNPLRIPSNINRNKLLNDLDFNESLPLITIFGGSLGSEFIDNLMIDVYNKITNINFIHISKKLKSKWENVKIFDYLDNLTEYLAISDMVISRGGATSLSEIDFFEIPAIIIPWGNSAENQQFLNAKGINKENIHIFTENDVKPQSIIDIIYNVKKKNNYTIKKQNPSKFIVKTILDSLGGA
ncbi:UDP-N-acetylglucosamine--N-acetylmuramyl-(pentapeptide) pyrophosphoryl-undecaprenol N-acetylglucosamine transferase [Marinitoga hydrogenitolerans DSM 16785]|uniref:UDP-N-acetylglucosamine--N-acetylmuramyl-(pentapeptide) pyrophosphoryl-undecaprenol N-acetylglucosamine transferase n=1 Tax=Marinitoga hydrogenitolerans (strain DSM 16785 / JCM 12826 / AT1271) TaxID=1122195 RepID=A0A1M4TFZ6_MARH1|nr:UDP-N-acetylglucosamine--N-acetylmuramyl-(pentapeptide) pyrophosphoryl-undecaprenol N-acetylglucosamine transferase [Marinitoga hydrogenitolerans]SHE43217.1 UDP-N-acetylglucosamine--N-acetylmuramyl-(pentapeptide) pyrophosphoryl-undecaprenol N-acetylglucosamine transferase [Marinitoga hydrogenitolerans DSM 16785]